MFVKTQNNLVALAHMHTQAHTCVSTHPLDMHTHMHTYGFTQSAATPFCLSCQLLLGFGMASSFFWACERKIKREKVHTHFLPDELCKYSHSPFERREMELWVRLQRERRLAAGSWGALLMFGTARCKDPFAPQ